MASPGNSWQSETLSDSSGPERAHPKPGGNQHRVLPHLWGMLVRLGARRGRCPHSWELCSRFWLSTTAPESCRGALHLHQRLEGTAGHLGEREGNEPWAKGGPEEEAARLVLWLSSADEGEVHWGHRREFFQNRLTGAFKSQHGKH